MSPMQGDELYYRFLTDQLELHKTIVNESIIDALNSPSPKTDMCVLQGKIIHQISEVIDADEIKKFSDNLNMYLGLREEILRGYITDRVAQTSEKYPDCEIERYMIVIAKHKSTGAVLAKETPVSAFVSEETMRSNIIKDSTIYLPRVNSDEPASLADFNILQSVNAVAFVTSKNKSRRYIELDTERRYAKDYSLESVLCGLANHSVYLIISRVKTDEREAQKVTDMVIGVRPDYHYDGIAEHIIVNSYRSMYDAVKEIHTLSNKAPFRADYRPQGILPPYHNRSIITELINTNSTLSERILRTGQMTDAERKQLLSGIWVDHFRKNMRMESIIQLRPFYEWYTVGPIGHTKSFYARRLRERDASHHNVKYGSMRVDVDLIAKFLDAQYRDIFSLTPFE
ncbi:MAG: hypothetical protein WC916_06105 [Candidatus Woesearchaeota archaeon]